MTTSVDQQRIQRTKLSIFSSLACQGVTVICGLIVPRLMLEAFGADAYGAMTSIAQFLSYIVLIDGGVGGIARVALYKPLAEGNFLQVSKILNEVRHFFRILAYIFLIYTFILACSFKYISNFQYFDWSNTFLLVFAISLSTLAQYLFGISYAVLLQTAQRIYITSLIQIGTLIINTLLIILLIKWGVGLLAVKFCSVLIFTLPPFFMYAYVKRHFPLVKTLQRDKEALKQKWVGLGQHLAWFLHGNTDIVVLTLCANLPLVAVYSVYNMIVSNISNTTLAFSSGMEAFFGDLLARNETDTLQRSFHYYETLLSLMGLILYLPTVLLIIPFIRLYTQGLTDAPYYQPLFSLLLALVGLIYCLRLGYMNIIYAAGHFKQTNAGAYGETALNVGLSVLLVWKYGLVGIVCATLIAVVFRWIYSVFYVSRHILYRPIGLWLKRSGVNLLTFIVGYFVGRQILSYFTITNYFQWIVAAVAVTVAGGSITCLLNVCFYRQDVAALVRQLPVLKKKRTVA